MSDDAPWLAELLRKYVALRNLRTASDVAERAWLRELATEFPGALRELDCLPLASIEARITGLQAALAGGNVEPWMRWMSAYHRRLRAALALKRAAPRGPAVPGGRLNPIIFRELAALFAVPAETIESVLFPKLGVSSMFRPD